MEKRSNGLHYCVTLLSFTGRFTPMNRDLYAIFFLPNLVLYLRSVRTYVSCNSNKHIATSHVSKLAAAAAAALFSDVFMLYHLLFTLRSVLPCSLLAIVFQQFPCLACCSFKILYSSSVHLVFFFAVVSNEVS